MLIVCGSAAKATVAAEADAESDAACQQLLAKFGAVKVQKIEPLLETVHSPPPSEPSN
jgi:hypothetical protein